jgi:hypothetical protein
MVQCSLYMHNPRVDIKDQFPRFHRDILLYMSLTTLKVFLPKTTLSSRHTITTTMLTLQSCLAQRSISIPIKSVRFTDSKPTVHHIAADMASWQVGEVCIGPPEHAVRNTEALTKEVLAAAKAEERRDCRQETYQAMKKRTAVAKALLEKRLTKVRL